MDGWKINVKFKVISDKNQFFPLEHYRELKNDLPEKYSPLDKNGKGCNNAYFTQISENLKNKLINPQSAVKTRLRYYYSTERSLYNEPKT